MVSTLWSSKASLTLPIMLLWRKAAEENFYDCFLEVINDAADTLLAGTYYTSLDRKYRLLSRHHVTDEDPRVLLLGKKERRGVEGKMPQLLNVMVPIQVHCGT